MKQRLILVAFGLAALTFLSIGLSAQERVKNEPTSPSELTASEQQLARQFAEFQDLLLRLKQKLARGNADEKKRAESLDKVLEACKDFAINQEFAKMIELIKGAKLRTGDLQVLAEQSDTIATRLAAVLRMLQDTNVDLSKDRQDLKAFLDKLQKILDDQRRTQAITDLSKTDPSELAKIQGKVTDNTADLKKKIDDYLNKDKKGKGGEASKGDDKDGGKGEGKKGESKDAGKDGKGAQGEAKDAGKETKGNKGEAKPGQDGKKAGDPKSGAKPGDGKGKEGSPGAAKESKDSKPGGEGSAKENKGDPKKGAEGGAKDAGKKDGGKEAAPAGAAKPGDDKKASDKPGSPDSKAKPGNPDAKPAGAKDSKPGSPMEAKPGDAKPGDAKAGDAKPGDAKPGDAKAGDAKPGSPSPPMAGQPPPQPPQAGAKGSDSPPPPPSNKQNDDVAKSNKQIHEAGYPMTEAEKNIKDKKNPAASKDQKKAIDLLEKAKKDLERLLAQMREEEMERVLAALQGRCEKMLLMQQRVLAGTIDIDKAIGKNADKKADRLNKIGSNKLSDDEKDIVQEANKCIDILKSEGSAVAFPEVFQQIRDDMIHVQKRLELTDVANTTQSIENDIIDTLKEMVDALRKAQQDMKDSKSKPGESKSGKPGDQKLLELIQELKMVRSLQKRINDRTAREGKRSPGEQANEPQVIRELRNLSERQLRLQEIIRRIANGDNK